jgi:hypothetical protein
MLHPFQTVQTVGTNVGRSTLEVTVSLSMDTSNNVGGPTLACGWHVFNHRCEGKHGRAYTFQWLP